MTVLLRSAPDTDLVGAVHAAAHDAARWVVGVARWRHGRELPDLGSAWIGAPRVVRVATLVVLGEAYLVASGLDVEVAAELDAARLKQTAVEISAAHDWSRRVSLAELERLRARPGRLARQVDPVAAQRWAATGCSAGKGGRNP